MCVCVCVCVCLCVFVCVTPCVTLYVLCGKKREKREREGPRNNFDRFCNVLLERSHKIAVFVDQAVMWSGHWATRQSSGVEEGVLVENSKWGCSLDFRERRHALERHNPKVGRADHSATSSRVRRVLDAAVCSGRAHVSGLTLEVEASVPQYFSPLHGLLNASNLDDHSTLVCGRVPNVFHDGRNDVVVPRWIDVMVLLVTIRDVSGDQTECT